MILYQNGVNNSLEDAAEGAKLIEGIVGDTVGIINNKTNGTGADLIEYAKDTYETKDLLTAYEYEKLSKNGEKNLVVAFSAGNEDAKKALDILAMEGRSLGNKVEFMSVGSPVSKKTLEEAASKVDGEIMGQYNDWKDPVADSLGWVAGTGATAVVGLGVGAVVGAGIASGAIPMTAYFGALIGGGIGGGAGISALKNYHTFGRVHRSKPRGRTK